VLAIGEGDKLTLGKPTIEGASVKATASANGRGDKVIVYHYKAKVRYSKKTGHRQGYTELHIESIAGPGIAAAEKPAAKPRRRTTKKEVTENGS
jgi:large subunit ribosomal protein L21